MPHVTTQATRSKTERTPWRQALAGVLFAAVISAAGCAASGRQPSPSTGHVPLPEYLAGTTFVYDDGTWETVETVAPEAVTWRNHRGHLSSGSPDFTYRSAQWETRTRSGTRRFRERRDWSGTPSLASVWPLAAGKTARYIELGRWRDEENREHTYESNWRLEVEGPAKISVAAGQFDVWKIVGRRFTRGDAFKPSRLREIRTWYYAPAVGHYVREERQYKGRRADRDKELLAVIPPVAHLNASAQTTMRTHFQKALEEQQSGKALRWTLADQALSGTTTPVATFRIDSGGYCRQYVQHLNRSGEERAFYGLACRTDAGRWEVPRR